MKIRVALFCFQHWTDDDNENIPVHFMMNIGPWEPQRFYDADDPMDSVITLVSTAYNAIADQLPSMGDSNVIEPTTTTKVVRSVDAESPWSQMPSEPPNEPLFMTNTTPIEIEGEPHFFDPSNNMSEKSRRGRAFHLSTDLNIFIRTAEVDNCLDNLEDEEMLGYYEPFDTLAFAIQARATIPEAEKLQLFLAWRPLEVIRRTLENTTQLARIRHDRVLQNHMKPWFPWLNRNRLHETVATDTMFSAIQDLSRRTCAQVYWGLSSHFINIYGMHTESEGPRTLDDFA